MVFIGMTLGSLIANQMLAYFGWSGVMGFAAAVAVIALMLRMKK
jgi:predicted MFS family arabinose efflux permease